MLSRPTDQRDFGENKKNIGSASLRENSDPILQGEDCLDEIDSESVSLTETSAIESLRNSVFNSPKYWEDRNESFKEVISLLVPKT